MFLVKSFIKGSDEIIFFARAFFNALYIYWNCKWYIKLCYTTGKTNKDSDEEEEDEDEDENETDTDISDDAAEDLDDDAADDDLQDLSDIDLADVDDDLSDMEFNGSEDEENVDELTSNLNKKLSKGPKSKKKKGIDNNIFVSVEKFAEMLEEQNKTKGKHGGSNVFSSSDGASAKQIDWEVKRHQRMKGFDKKKRKSVQAFDNNRVKRLKR